MEPTLTLDYQPLLYEGSDKRLMALFVVVNVGLALIYKQLFISDYNVGYVLIFQGQGTATKEMYKMLGLSQLKKEVILAIIPESKVNDLLYAIRSQFIVSKRTKGVAFAVELNSIINLKTYKFLMDVDNKEKEE